jgi:hypothetical protein
MNNATAEGERLSAPIPSSLKDSSIVAGLQNVIRNISDFIIAVSSTEATSTPHEGRNIINMGSSFSEHETVAQGLHDALSDANILTRLNSSVSSAVNSTISPIDNYINDNMFADDINFSTNLAIRILMQICIHLIGMHILIMTFVRMRGTFMKVGQSLLVRRQLEVEKQLKEKMIHSVMPPKVADWLMEESEREREISI